jgi:uncharacterized protein (TIGR02145 family)
MKKLFLLSIFSCIIMLIAAQNATTDEGVEINGVIWATRNVDAPGTFAENPEDPGMFYQWGSNVGWSATNPLVSTDGSSWLYPWDANGAETWENNVCPSGWRLPTNTEFSDLVSGAQNWETINGKSGRHFGIGNSTIFLPAASFRNYDNGTLNNIGINSRGTYWIDSKVEGQSKSFWLDFYSDVLHINGNCSRAFGFSVRCVKENTSSSILTNIDKEYIKIYTRPHTIIVENAISPVSIYNLTGQLIIQGAQTEFSVPTAGIYIVRVGSYVEKVIVP